MPNITEGQPLEQRARRKDRDQATPREPVSKQTASSNNPSLAAVSNPLIAAVSNSAIAAVSNLSIAAVSNPSPADVSNPVQFSSFPARQVQKVDKLDEEKEDLDFLESLEAGAPPAEGGDKARPDAAVVVVPVQIIKEEEKKDLEDWLDDFLDD